MRRLIAIMACLAVLNTAQAQWQALAPTPFGVAMTVGQWLWANNKRVYYIEVTGSGRTADDARLNGFRLAVEQALGSVIASETEQRNSQIRRDEVISYAAGFVERYEIVTTMNVGIGYEIQMRVWVQRTNLAERLLVKSQADGQVDGARAAIAVDTAQYSRSQGDRLLTTVLRDFPERSFDVKLEPTRVEMDSNRNTELIVPFLITWNKQYIKSLMESWRKVETCGWNGCVMDKPTNDLIFDEMIHSRPQILIIINSLAGTTQHSHCYPLEQKNIADVSERWKHRYIVPVSNQHLANMSQVQVRVVRQADCPKQVLVYHK
jgi:hypothetical protein